MCNYFFASFTLNNDKLYVFFRLSLGVESQATMSKYNEYSLHSLMCLKYGCKESRGRGS